MYLTFDSLSQNLLLVLEKKDLGGTYNLDVNSLDYIGKFAFEVVQINLNNLGGINDGF